MENARKCWVIISWRNLVNGESERKFESLRVKSAGYVVGNWRELGIHNRLGAGGCKTFVRGVGEHTQIADFAAAINCKHNPNSTRSDKGGVAFDVKIPAGTNGIFDLAQITSQRCATSCDRRTTTIRQAAFDARGSSLRLILSSTIWWLRSGQCRSCGCGSGPAQS